MSRLSKTFCCFWSDSSVKCFKGLGLIKSTFWREVLSCWLDNKQKWSAETPAKIALEKQCLWNNSNISYRKQTLLFRDWIDSGFSLVKDILENDNTIMTLKTICEKVGHKPTRLFEYGAMRYWANREAGLIEWMRFVIFRARSRDWEVAAHFRADFWVGVASRCA